MLITSQKSPVGMSNRTNHWHIHRNNTSTKPPSSFLILLHDPRDETRPNSRFRHRNLNKITIKPQFV